MPDITAPQPAPIKNDNPASWDLVAQDFEEGGGEVEGPSTAILVDMRNRDRFGLEKYGTRLQPHNGRDSMVDAYQEILDGAVYFRTALYELEEAGDTAAPELNGMYRRTLDLLMEIRTAIWNRDGK